MVDLSASANLRPHKCDLYQTIFVQDRGGEGC